MNNLLNKIIRLFKIIKYKLDNFYNFRFVESKEYKEDLVAFLELLQYQKRIILLGKKLTDEAGIYNYNGSFVSLDMVIRLFRKQWSKSHNSLNINKEIEKVKEDLKLYS